MWVGRPSGAAADVTADKIWAPKRGCFSPGDKPLALLEQTVSSRNLAAYQAALRRRGLRKARVAGGTLQLHRGVRGASHQRSHRFGTMVVTTVNGVTGRYLAGHSWWSGAARTPPAPELVTDGKGNFYFVRRHPLPGPTTRAVMCGCAQRKCGPYGSGCPACGTTVQTMYGPFRASDRFRGHIEIRFRRHALERHYQRGACPPRRCPAPPPSMRRR